MENKEKATAAVSSRTITLHDYPVDAKILSQRIQGQPIGKHEQRLEQNTIL